MKKNSICLWTTILAVSMLSISCGSVKPQIDDASRTVEERRVIPHPTHSPDQLHPDSLCEILAELKEIPYYPGEATDDPVYNKLMDAGDKAIPCLIDKITDTTRIDDPRIAPHIQHFTVGDAAVWLLLYITKLEWQPEEMFPPKYSRRWKTEGVYAYFAYVEKPQNRRALQNWWKTWWEKQSPKKETD